MLYHYYFLIQFRRLPKIIRVHFYKNTFNCILTYNVFTIHGFYYFFAYYLIAIVDTVYFCMCVLIHAKSLLFFNTALKFSEYETCAFFYYTSIYIFTFITFLQYIPFIYFFSIIFYSYR